MFKVILLILITAFILKYVNVGVFISVSIALFFVSWVIAMLSVYC